MKTCYACKESKTEDSFFKDSSRHDGLNNKCKTCDKAYKANKWAQGGRIKYYAKTIETKYGITFKEYEELLLKQGSRCAICNSKAQEDKFLSVDHCHKTGEVRGLLCSHCNFGIGHLRDDRTILLSAVDYLDRAC